MSELTYVRSPTDDRGNNTKGTLRKHSENHWHSIFSRSIPVRNSRITLKSMFLLGEPTCYREGVWFHLRTPKDDRGNNTKVAMRKPNEHNWNSTFFWSTPWAIPGLARWARWQLSKAQTCWSHDSVREAVVSLWNGPLRTLPATWGSTCQGYGLSLHCKFLWFIIEPNVPYFDGENKQQQYTRIEN